MGIHRWQVVLNKAAIFRLILLDDAEVIIGKPFRSVYGFALAHVRSTSVHDDVLGDLQSNGAVDAALTTVIMFVISVERHNLKAKEAGCSGSSMRDQGFLGRQFQSQFVAKERADPMFDLLCLGSRPTEAEQGV